MVALNGSAAGLFEELVFRGLVLHALIRAWGDSPTGVGRAVILSSLLFGASHFIHLATGRPFSHVGFLVADAAISGIYYAGFVLFNGSLWPAIVIHVGLNAGVGARAVGVEGLEESVSAWIVILVFELPALLLGAWLIRRTLSTFPREEARWPPSPPGRS